MIMDALQKLKNIQSNLLYFSNLYLYLWNVNIRSSWSQEIFEAFLPEDSHLVIENFIIYSSLDCMFSSYVLPAHHRYLILLLLFIYLLFFFFKKKTWRSISWNVLHPSSQRFYMIALNSVLPLFPLSAVAEGVRSLAPLKFENFFIWHLIFIYCLILIFFIFYFFVFENNFPELILAPTGFVS